MARADKQRHYPATRLGPRVLRVLGWADLHGDDLAGALRLDPEDDAETIGAVDDALLLVGELWMAVREVEGYATNSRWTDDERRKAIVSVCKRVQR